MKKKIALTLIALATIGLVAAGVHAIDCYFNVRYYEGYYVGVFYKDKVTGEVFKQVSENPKNIVITQFDSGRIAPIVEVEEGSILAQNWIISQQAPLKRVLKRGPVFPMFRKP